MKKFRIEYQAFLLRFCTHRNEFICVFTFRSKLLGKYAIHSLIWGYVYFRFQYIGDVQMKLMNPVLKAALRLTQIQNSFTKRLPP